MPGNQINDEQDALRRHKGFDADQRKRVIKRAETISVFGEGA